MVLKNISDPIEFSVTGHDYYTYSLFYSNDTVNALYTGKVYPFPQFTTTTKQGIIKLNDLMETYLYSRPSFFIGADVNSRVDYILPTQFTLKVYDTTNTLINTETYSIRNRYYKHGEYDTTTIMKNVTSRYSNNTNPVPITFNTPTSTIGQTFICVLQSYSNGTYTGEGYIGVVFNASTPNSIVHLTLTFDTYKTSVYQGNTYTNDMFKVSYPIELATYTQNPNNATYPYTFYYDSCYTGPWVYYYNRYGAVECLSFSQSSKMNTSSTFVDYETDYRKLVGTSYTDLTEEFGITRKQIDSFDTYVLKTKLLTTAEHNALADLYTSPQVCGPSDLVSSVYKIIRRRRETYDSI